MKKLFLALLMWLPLSVFAASGDTLLIFVPINSYPPGTAPADFYVMPGADGSAPENIPMIAFDQTTEEYMDWVAVMPQHYDSGGLTLRFYFAATVNSNNCEFEAGFRTIEEDAEDLDTTDHAYDRNEKSVTVPSAVGEVQVDTITFTDGADSDNVDAGDLFLLRVMRDTTPDTGTNAAGDCQMVAMMLEET